MLTTTYILVQKGVIHSVTVTKKFCVCCFGEWRQGHLGGWLSGRPAARHQHGGEPVHEQGHPFIKSPCCPCGEEGIPVSSCRALLWASAPPHLLFTESGHLVSLHWVSACHRSSLRSTTVCSKALAHLGLSWFQARLVRGLPHDGPDMSRETFSFAPPAPIIEIPRVRKGNKRVGLVKVSGEHFFPAPVMFVAWIRPWWEYLHYGNHQTLQIGVFVFTVWWLVVKHLPAQCWMRHREQKVGAWISKSLITLSIPSHRSCSNVLAEPLLYSLTTAIDSGEPQKVLCVLLLSIRFVS